MVTLCLEMSELEYDMCDDPDTGNVACRLKRGHTHTTGKEWGVTFLIFSTDLNNRAPRLL